jgi:hypothetical protein
MKGQKIFNIIKENVNNTQRRKSVTVIYSNNNIGNNNYNNMYDDYGYEQNMQNEYEEVEKHNEEYYKGYNDEYNDSMEENIEEGQKNETGYGLYALANRFDEF